MMITEKCRRCGFVDTAPEPLEVTMRKELKYMIKHADCKFAGLLGLLDSELDISLKTMLKRGLVARKEDGFYPTDEGKKFSYT